MSEQKSDSATQNAKATTERAARAERLAKALRQNLNKRKAQGRNRQAGNKNEG
jgi:hypothetical protein